MTESNILSTIYKRKKNEIGLRNSEINLTSESWKKPFSAHQETFIQTQDMAIKEADKIKAVGVKEAFRGTLTWK